MNKAKERRNQSSWNGSNSILFLDDPLFMLLNVFFHGYSSVQNWFPTQNLWQLLYHFSVRCACFNRFEINRELALRIVEDNTYYPKLKEFCKPHKCYVDEHYFQTMLTINTPHLLANRSLTYVDWSRGGAHPTTFGKDDIKEEFFKKILQDQTCLYNNQPSSLCFLFARKFAPNALGPLLDIAPKALGIGKRPGF